MDPQHHPTRQRRGLLIVLSSPSGAGKSTISRMLLEADNDVTMSVSATTRPKRPGEADDVDYHFVDDAEFDGMIDAGEFVEWAQVFGYRYGTPEGADEGRRCERAATSCSTSTGRERSSSRRRWARISSRSSSFPRRWTSWSAACARAAPISEEVIADRMQRAAERDQPLARI